VAVVNAFNLFDNMDGAASAMALVVAAGACILALVSGDSWVAAGSAALCGACLGFLPHNLASPARVFLGDGGSMPLGFAVAALVAGAARSAEPSLLALLVGFLLVGIPALDTCLVIVSRRRRGVSILTGGQDHLTHRTRTRMRTARQVALVLGSAQALVSALVIVAGRGSSIALVYILLAFVVAAAATIGGLEDVAASATVETPEDTAGAVRERAPPPAFRRAGLDKRARERVALICLAALGLGAGISPLFAAYYDTGVWVPIGLAVVLAAGVTTIARPPRLTWPTVLAFTAIAGLGLWSLLSADWAPTERRHAAALLVGAGLGTAIVAVSVLVQMLGSDPSSLFVLGRLSSPVGYVNGEGAAFAMGCWLSLAVAERREPLLAGLGAAATVAMACLTVLTESRGAAIATIVTVALALVAIPGRRRRVLALTVVAGAVGAVASTVLRVYSNAGVPRAAVVHAAAEAILAASVVAGVAWALLVAVARAENARGGARAARLRRVATAIAIAVIMLPALVGVVRISTIERTFRTQWHTFLHVDSRPESAGSSSGATPTRLLSGAGDRYDYWRIARSVFAAHPVIGVGAGGYTKSYFRQRRTQEAIQNPHSLELEILSELGIVGGLLLAALVAAVALGARKLRAEARQSPAARTMMVAATGIVMVWFVSASGDWIHLLPGVTLVALGGVAVLFRSAGSSRAADGPGARRLPALLAAAGVAFVLAVAGASLLRAGLTQLYIDDARSELSAHPSAALNDARRAIALDAANLDAYYLKAAALARFNNAAEAQATLLAAVRQDPASFVTWTLLGDLEVRLTDFRAAKTFYGRAHALDPQDKTLRALAIDPTGASR
jgi:O-antigen ligase